MSNEQSEPPEIETRAEFKVHKLNEEGLRRARDLAKLFSAFLNNVEAQCGTGGREMALVRTKLEEASYFAKRAIAVVASNQVEE